MLLLRVILSNSFFRILLQYIKANIKCELNFYLQDLKQLSEHELAYSSKNPFISFPFISFRK